MTGLKNGILIYLQTFDAFAERQPPLPTFAAEMEVAPRAARALAITLSTIVLIVEEVTLLAGLGISRKEPREVFSHPCNKLAPNHYK